MVDQTELDLCYTLALYLPRTTTKPGALCDC